MNRRSFLSLAACGLPISVLSRAEVQCGPPMPPVGAQNCMSGIASGRLNMIYASQSMNEWCWAACISMVFAFYGYDVPQPEVVRQAWGQIVNMPGSPQQILQSLNRPWFDAGGRSFVVSGDIFSATPVTAAQDLSSNMPLILCSLGHAVVFTRLDYQRFPNGTGNPQAAYVRDPWPGRGTRVLSPQEWYSTGLLIRIRVTHA